MAKPRSKFRKVIEWLHVWLGLLSGIVVFIVCLTGALWVFRYEVYYFTEPYQRVAVQQKQFLPPSELIRKAKAYLKSDSAVLNEVTYGAAGRPVTLGYHIGKSGQAELYFNPYTGSILKDKRAEDSTDNFFMFVRAGHRFLWLPQKYGSPIVGSFCLLFLLITITGLVWWYPRKWTKKNRDSGLKIKWNAKWKRLNIDLHNVVGFYASIFILLLTLTGVMFTFQWVNDGVFKTLAWHDPIPERQDAPYSDTVSMSKTVITDPLDLIWRQVAKEHSDYGKVILLVPDERKEAYQVMVFFGDGTLIYDQEHYFFDQRTLKPLRYTSEEDKPYAQNTTGEKAYRMYFDIHTGQILGLPTKIIAFLACLVGASLPVTGTLIWYNRKWGKKKKCQSIP